MNILKVSESYINFDNVTHAEFATLPQGLMCTVFFNCQVTDRTGCNGIQACKTFTADDARTLKSWLDLRVNVMEQQS
jgi:hypothetical protein